MRLPCLAPALPGDRSRAGRSRRRAAKGRRPLRFPDEGARLRDRIDVLQHRLHDLVGEVGVGDDPETQTGDRVVPLLGEARLEKRKVALNLLRTVFASQGVGEDHAHWRGSR